MRFASGDKFGIQCVVQTMILDTGGARIAAGIPLLEGVCPIDFTHCRPLIYIPLHKGYSPTPFLRSRVPHVCHQA